MSLINILCRIEIFDLFIYYLLDVFMDSGIN